MVITMMTIGVLASKDSCDPFHDKAIKAAAGATFWIPVSTRQMTLVSYSHCLFRQLTRNIAKRHYPTTSKGILKAISSENLTPIIAVPSGIVFHNALLIRLLIPSI